MSIMCMTLCGVFTVEEKKSKREGEGGGEEELKIYSSMSGNQG